MTDYRYNPVTNTMEQKDPYDEYREPPQGCGTAIAGGVAIIALIVLVCISMCSCASTKTIEKVNYRDSLITKTVYDTVRVTVTDTIHYEQHSSKETENGTEITFGQGGGTYNAKTGEATNVTGVKESSKIREQDDIIQKQKTQIDLYSARCDSLSSAVSNYASELETERTVPKRSGYDRFCSWWFWITAILFLIKIAAWVMEKIPMTAPYVMIARKFIPFL